eukprot:jgi/Ulvmu1/10111/UM006_0061.1
MRLGRSFCFSVLVICACTVLGFVTMPNALRMGFSVLFVLLSVVVPWGYRLAPIMAKKRHSRRSFCLESIRVSHFVERVRWCLDLSGASYTEEANVAVLGIFLLGRPVPQLRIISPDTGVNTATGSASCTRMLHGTLQRDGADPESLRWLELTPEIAQLEGRLDKFGVDIQRMIYGQMLPLSKDDPSSLLHAWGVNDDTLPLWQRIMLRLMFPVLVKFMGQAFPASAAPQAERRAETVLFELEKMLEDDRRYIMGDTFTYADIVLASVMAPWALSGNSRPLFAGGRDCGTFSKAALPPRTLKWQRQMQTAFPRVFELILRLYSSHRLRRRSQS